MPDPTTAITFTTGETDTTDVPSTLVPPEASQRRSSRSPSRPLALDQAPFPRTLPTEHVGRATGKKAASASRPPTLSPSAPGPAKAVPSTTARQGPSAARPPRDQPNAPMSGHPRSSKSNSLPPPAKEVRPNSPRPPSPGLPTMSPVGQSKDLPPSLPASLPTQRLPSRSAPLRRTQRSDTSSAPGTDSHLSTTKASATPADPNLLAPPSPITGGNEKTRETSIDPEEPEPQVESRRAGKSYFSVESDDEEVFSDDDPRTKPRAKPKLASDSDRSVDEREEEDEEESEDDGDMFQPPDSRGYIPNDDADSVDDDEPEEEVDSEEDTPRQVSPPLSLQVGHLRHNSERLLSCSAHTGQSHQQHRIRQ